MKEFDLELAKQGKPICTRNGRKARILCFDLKYYDHPICAAIETESCGENPTTYTLGGRFFSDKESDFDLMLVEEKHEGWINIGKGNVVGTAIYPSEEEAKKEFNLYPNIYTTTIKIQWED